MTDEEIWALIVKNQRLAFYFANKYAGNEKAKYFLSYLYAVLFSFIQNGSLDKGTMGTTFHFAAKTAWREYRTKERSAIALPLHLSNHSAKILDAALAGEAYTGKHSLDRYTTALVANTLFQDKIDIEFTDGVGAMPDYHNIHCTVVDPIDEYMGAPLDDALYFMAEQLTPRRYANWRESSAAIQALYCLARRYEIELRVYLMDPAIFGIDTKYDLVTAYMSRYNDEQDLIQDRHDSLIAIGKTLGVSRERVRQILEKAESALQEFT